MLFLPFICAVRGGGHGGAHGSLRIRAAASVHGDDRGGDGGRR